MTDIHKQIKAIQDFIAQDGWNKARLAREAGLNRCVTHKLDSGHWNPTASTLAKIQEVMRRYGW